MGFVKAFNGFEFYNDFIVNNEVCTEPFVESHSCVFERNGNLALNEKVLSLKLFFEDCFVNGFEQSRSEILMKSNCGVDDDVANFVFCHENENGGQFA